MDTIICETQEEYDVLKRKALMAKVVLLDKNNEHPLMNPSLFSGKKKQKFVDDLKEMMNYDYDLLTEQFNDVVNSNLLAGGADISQYPIYETPETVL